MFSSTLFAAAAFAVSMVSAQATNFSMTPGQYTVTPDSVSITIRNSWCLAQQNSCPYICGGVATSNSCDADNLTYSCVCQSGSSPNISDYLQTVPALECLQWQADCQLYYGNQGNAEAQQTICQAISCGSKLVNTGATTSSASSSTTSAPASSSSASSTTSSSSSSPSAATATPTPTHGAAAHLTAAREYGTLALGAGLFLAFGVAL